MEIKKISSTFMTLLACVMLMQSARSQQEDPWVDELIETFQPVLKKSGESTVAILVDGRQVALGVVISEDGKVLTKASEVVDKGGISIALSVDKSYPAAVTSVFEKYDIAVVKADIAGLKPVEWYDGALPELGSFLAAPSLDGNVLAFGGMSVAPRSLMPKERGFLGIGIEAVEKGIRVTALVPKGAAASAGLKQEDIVTKLNEKAYTSSAEFAKTISSFKRGETVKLSFLRDGKEKEIEIQLGARVEGNNRENRRFRMMNRMGGDLSSNRSGYPSVLQHDLPIPPRFIGGPLVDIYGNVVGINIARAGRIRTFAIPSNEIANVLEGANGTSSIEVSADDLSAEIDAMQKELRKTAKTLEKLEKQIKETLE